MKKESNKIYLVYTANRKYYPFFPLSSLVLASELMKAGYCTEIIDTEVSGYEHVDFSDALCACITAYTAPWLKNALKVARKIRKSSPGTKIFWGGPHAVALPEMTARHPLADAVCYAEGEKAVVALADHARDGNDDYRDVNGVVFRSKDGKIVRTGPPGHTNLDASDFPPYGLLDVDLYRPRGGTLFYQTSRGCLHRCAFCLYENGGAWHARSPGKVVADVEKLVSLFDPRMIDFFDSDFFADRDRARSMAQAFSRETFSFAWSAFCRFDTFEKMSDDDLQLLKRSRCRELKFGAESGSEKILDYVGKKIKPRQIIDGVMRCKKYDIVPTLSFMTGFPIETRNDFLETIGLIKRLKKDNPDLRVNGLFMLQHIPRTLLTDALVKERCITLPGTLEKCAEQSTIWATGDRYPWLHPSEYSFRRTMSSIVTYTYVSDLLRNVLKQQRNRRVLRSRLLFCLVMAIDYVIRKVFVRLRWEWGVTAWPAEWRLWDWFKQHFLELS